MEHRLSERRPINLDVLIFYQGLPVGSGRTRNIGHEGMFIETEIRDFPEGTTLDIELDMDSGEGEQRVRLLALIIHRNGEGMGLMFLTLIPEIHDILQTLGSLQT